MKYERHLMHFIAGSSQCQTVVLSSSIVAVYSYYNYTGIQPVSLSYLPHLWPHCLQYFCMLTIVNVAKGCGILIRLSFFTKMTLMLSITGVLFLISLIILVNLPSCAFVLLIIPQLNFHTQLMVRVFPDTGKIGQNPTLILLWKM